MSQTEIHPSAQIHPGAVIGTGTIVEANAVIGENVVIGRNCMISAGAVIGARPFDDNEGRFPIEIADNARIGANSTVQYGVARPTRIGRGTWVNHSCAVGHDVWLGEGVQFGLAATVSGHSNIGDRVKIGPGSTLTDRSEVGADAVIGIGSLVLHPVAAGTMVMGRPAELRADHIEAARRLRELLGMERPERRITGAGNRYMRLIPRWLKQLIKRILGRA